MKGFVAAALTALTLAGCADGYAYYDPGYSYASYGYQGGYSYAGHYDRPRYRHRVRYARRGYYDAPSYGSGYGGCHARTTETGDQRPTEGLARRAANKAWAQAVRARFGEQFTGLSSARGASYRCFASSVNGFLKRCELSATPCRAR